MNNYHEVIEMTKKDAWFKLTNQKPDRFPDVNEILPCNGDDLDCIDLEEISENQYCIFFRAKIQGGN